MLVAYIKGKLILSRSLEHDVNHLRKLNRVWVKRLLNSLRTFTFYTRENRKSRNEITGNHLFLVKHLVQKMRRKNRKAFVLFTWLYDTREFITQKTKLTSENILVQLVSMDTILNQKSNIAFTGLHITDHVESSSGGQTKQVTLGRCCFWFSAITEIWNISKVPSSQTEHEHKVCRVWGPNDSQVKHRLNTKSHNHRINFCRSAEHYSTFTLSGRQWNSFT